MNDRIYGRCKILFDWPDWDYSIHTGPEQIERQGRAMTYPFTFELDEYKEAARFSSTSDLPYYDTTLASCTCYDFAKRKLPCKHIYRLAAEFGYIEIIKRPSFDKKAVQEIKRSKDIDASPDQIKRMEKAKEAKCAPVSIDYEARTAIFQGSGKSPYETTTENCTCRDFFVRRLPCKHIYRLRMELDAADQK